MKIEYFGHSFVKITFRDFSVAIDPYGDIGLTPPKVFADYVFCSHNHYDHNNAGFISGAKRIDAGNIKDSGGRFEIIKTFHDEAFGALRGENDALIINADGKKIVHFGDAGCFDEALVEKARGADIIFIPVGGKYTIDAAGAKRYVEAINPKTVIPIHYKIDGSTVDIAKIDEFLKLIKEFKTEKSGFLYNVNEKGVIVVTPEVKHV